MLSSEVDKSKFSSALFSSCFLLLLFFFKHLSSPSLLFWGHILLQLLSSVVNFAVSFFGLALLWLLSMSICYLPTNILWIKPTLVVLTLFPVLQLHPLRSGSTLHSSPSMQGCIWHHHFCATMDAEKWMRKKRKKTVKIKKRRILGAINSMLFESIARAQAKKKKNKCLWFPYYSTYDWRGHLLISSWQGRTVSSAPVCFQVWITGRGSMSSRWVLCKGTWSVRRLDVCM